MRWLLTLLLCVACGGSSGGGPTPTPLPPLDMNFTGTWTGPLTVAIESNPTNTLTGRIVISVNGQRAQVSSVCPDGSGLVIAAGTGIHAQWGGTGSDAIICPSVRFTNCSAVTFTYFSAILDLTGPNSLTAVGLGSASGCGGTFRLTTTLMATK